MVTHTTRHCRLCCFYLALADIDLSLSLSRTDIFIESYHKEWKNDYKRLERVHSYIQWYVRLLLCHRYSRGLEN